MSLGQIIRHRREELGMTQDQVSAMADISKPYLSNIETERAKNPPTDGMLVNLERVLRFGAGELVRLAHIVRTPMDVRQEHERLEAQVQRYRAVLKELMADGSRGIGQTVSLDELEQEGSAPNVAEIPAGLLVPVINKVAAGYPHMFTDLDYPTSVADEYIRVPDLHDPNAFAARVVGDSMEPAYREGDVVVFAPNSPARNGDDCFVRFEADEGTTFKRFYLDGEQNIRLQPLNDKYAATIVHRERVTGLWPAVYKVQKLR